MTDRVASATSPDFLAQKNPPSSSDSATLGKRRKRVPRVLQDFGRHDRSGKARPYREPLESTDDLWIRCHAETHGRLIHGQDL